MIGASLFMVLQTKSQPSPYDDPSAASSYFCLFGYLSPPTVSLLFIEVLTWMNYRYQAGIKGQRHEGTNFFSFPSVPLCLCASVPPLSVAHTPANRYSHPRSANIRSISRCDLASRSIRYSCMAEYYFPYSHGIAQLRHRGLHFISHMKQFSYLREGQTSIDNITI